MLALNLLRSSCPVGSYLSLEALNLHAEALNLYLRAPNLSLVVLYFSSCFWPGINKSIREMLRIPMERFEAQRQRIISIWPSNKFRMTFKTSDDLGMHQRSNESSMKKKLFCFIRSWYQKQNKSMFNQKNCHDL